MLADAASRAAAEKKIRATGLYWAEMSEQDCREIALARFGSESTEAAGAVIAELGGLEIVELDVVSSITLDVRAISQAGALSDAFERGRVVFARSLGAGGGQILSAFDPIVCGPCVLWCVIRQTDASRALRVEPFGDVLLPAPTEWTPAVRDVMWSDLAEYLRSGKIPLEPKMKPRSRRWLSSILTVIGELLEHFVIECLLLTSVVVIIWLVVVFGK